MKKLSLVFLCCLAFFFALAQQSSPITLNISRASLLEVLTSIERQAGVTFSYSSDVVDVKQKVSVKLDHVPLDQALKQVFSGLPIGYTINGSQVTLYYKRNYQVTLSGFVREKHSGELLIGASVSTKPLVAGAITNAYGFYSITLPADTYQLVVNYVGYQPALQTVFATSSQRVNMMLQPKNTFDEVLVTAQQDKKELTLNRVNLSLQEIKEVPSILGERDVLKYMMLSSGVQKGNEGNGYVYVRGGGPDQNLIMIDDAVIYNAYHFLGLASLFTGNELRKAELYKGAFPSRYGGRLSSVLDMSMKDGSTEEFGADATVGAISSRLLLEGPIVKSKSSFLISARKSYISQVASWVAPSASSVLDYGYYDIHAKLSTHIGLKDRLMLSGYLGQDALINDKTLGLQALDDGITWGNRAASLRWAHQFSGKVFGNTSLVYSYYRARIAFGQQTDENGTTRLTSTATESSIRDYTIKHDLDVVLNKKQSFRFGLGYTNHQFKPITEFKAFSPDSFITIGNKNDAHEAFAYGEWNVHFSSKLTMNTGLRASYYDAVKSYFRLEPRVNISYFIKPDWQLTSSYSLMNQYLHLLSTFNGIGMPSDVWLSSDEVLKPQRAHVLTSGMVKNDLFGIGLSFSVEGYWKQVENTVALREGASFFQLLLSSYTNSNVNRFSDLTTQGKANAYGVEFMIRKSGKKVEGFVSYTLSKTQMQFESINNGKWFNATYDRPNDVGLFICYRPTKHWSLSTNWVYGTGNAISLPVGAYFPIVNDPSGGGGNGMWSSLYYKQKNTFRMQAYHRLDVSVQYVHRIRKRFMCTWELSVYNTYNRANPFFYELAYADEASSSGKRILRKNSLFPTMPTISWSIKL
jgi:hypothetical protein